MVKVSFITVEYRTTFVHTLPATDLSNAYPLLCTTQILSDAVQLLSTTTERNEPMWQYFVNSFVIAMKEILENELVKLESQDTALYVKSQVACHLCLVMSAIPVPEASQQVLILLLETVQGVEQDDCLAAMVEMLCSPEQQSVILRCTEE